MNMPSVLDSIGETVNNLRKEIVLCEQLKNMEYHWSNLIPFESGLYPKSNTLGVYGIFYIPDGRFLYFGQGIMRQRLINHASPFFGTGTKSEIGRKMYDHDPNLANWSFSYVTINSKSVAKEYETNCMIHHNTMYEGFNEKYKENS
jgi:hypothetical protein